MISSPLGRSLLFLSLLLGFSLRAADPQPDFAREILPLLSEKCFACHGPDVGERKAGLRLDEEAGAFAALKSGRRAVVAGDRKASSLFERISSKDRDEQMPPPDSGKSLSAKEIELLARWIDSGAEWGKHWAFVRPERPPVPPAVEGWRSANAVDRFVHRKLKERGLAPAERASPETLIRRLTLDLTGLPPTLAEVEAYVAEARGDEDAAYDRLVQRLLASKSYGEHMARIWLDAARYADTHGLHLDNERSVWPYREWVIEAFLANMPFDEFTVEQLAGDLLPEPRVDQRVATGFNRCNVTTGEGGSIDAEYYVRYAVERVETTSTVWLGLTAGCAACHDHKFDPLTQKDFYQLFSYFYSLTERAMDGNVLLPPPAVKVETWLQRDARERAEAELVAVRREIDSTLDGIRYEDRLAGETLGKLERKDQVWFDDVLPEGAQAQGNEGGNSWQFVEAPVASGGLELPPGAKASRRRAEGLSQHFFTGANSPLVIAEGDFLYAWVWLDPKNPPETVQLQFNDGSWEHRGYWGADKGHAPGRNNASNLRLGELPKTGEWVRLEIEAQKVGLKPGSKLNGWAFTQYGGTVFWDAAGITSVAPLPDAKRSSLTLWEEYWQKTARPAVPGEIAAILKTKKKDRSKEQAKALERYFLERVNPETQALFAESFERRNALEKQLVELAKSLPSTLVMQDRPEPRQAYILERGQYTRPKDKVSSRTPEWIAAPLEDQPPNRLGLARWIVSEDHPLTARVTVNRYWQQFFGTGLVRTSEDFGVQGEHPSHPELLDWLAREFIDGARSPDGKGGWDVKRLLTLLVTSETYRQSSRVTPEKLEADLDNRLLARGARFRLDAETIRDQALALSGLLVNRVGGKSVKPYQPAGLWAPVGFGGSNTAKFVQDKGEGLYRRSMYTFWKRTSPPPSLATFDAPNRETCQVRRARTNTPLQALVLMNDVQYVEAARKFAERVMQEGGPTTSERLRFAFRTALAREPSPRESESLRRVHLEALGEFRQNSEAARQLLATGESPRDESLDASELATWTLVTHLLLNLSETITRG